MSYYRPCPFCGGTKIKLDALRTIKVICSDCGAHTRDITITSDADGLPGISGAAKEAQKLWNERINNMTKDEVKEVVADTVAELRKTGLIRRYDDVAYSEISSRLYAHYKDQAKDAELADALEKIKTDEYFDIIPQYFQQKLTVDWIAEAYRCDFSTISRNKKRLCLRLFNLLS